VTGRFYKYLAALQVRVLKEKLVQSQQLVKLALVEELAAAVFELEELA